jgi:serine/threonine protein kinase
MTPKIYSGSPYSFEVDVCSLGYILYELMTFNSPFPAIFDIIYQPVQVIHSNYSKQLKELVYTMLQKNPREQIRFN